MLEKIEYVRKNDRITIVRCYGTGPVAELPEQIEGLPVTELADHCFAGERSADYRQEELQSVTLRTWEEEKQYPVLDTIYIEEIILPRFLTAIGNYAFYGCRRLERLYITGGFCRLGGGVFVACNHIRQLFFTVEPSFGGRDTALEQGQRGVAEPGKLPEAVKDFIWELPYELEVILTERMPGKGEDSERKPLLHLIYPGYYEESKENTPARIIEIVYHGTGYKYRQCFAGHQIEYHQYDHLFPLTVVQEAPETVLKLALCRLETPVGLQPDSVEQYLNWLRKEYERTAAYILSANRGDLIRLLADCGYYTQEILEYFLDQASRQKRAEEVSCLMDLRRKQFPKKKKEFEFD